MYSIEFRKVVLQLYDYFQSMRKTAEALKISISSISRWTKNICPKQRTRRCIKTSDALVAFIKNIISSRPATSCPEIVAEINKVFGFLVSKQLVHLILQRLGFSFKRIRKRGKSKKKPEILATFIEYIKNLPSDTNIVAIDESGFNHFPSPIYGYSLKGQPAIVEFVPSNDRVRYSLLMAISKTGQIEYSISSQNVTGDIYNKFIDKLQCSHGSILLMDNASIHKTKILKEIITEKNLNICYTPPYSPEFNPIELVFGIIKQKFYKQRYTGYTSIIESIKDCIASLTAEVIKNCFAHVENLIKKMI